LQDRQTPETEAELALHSAYADGLTYAGNLTLDEIEDQGTELGISICQDLAARKDFFLISDLAPPDYVTQLYHDDRALPDLWEKGPRVAEAIAFWQGMNDVYEFAICFETRAIYKDDSRRIRATVEKSLRQENLLDIWEEAKRVAINASPTPPPSGAKTPPEQRPAPDR
jgi:hypothetical protein